MADRIFCADVARMTGMSVRAVQEKAAAGVIPSAARLGRSWSFDPARVQAWIRSKEQEIARRAAHVPPTYVGLRRERISACKDEAIRAAYDQLIYRKGRPLLQPEASDHGKGSKVPAGKRGGK